MDIEEQRRYLIQELLKEDHQYASVRIPQEEEEQRRLLRGLMNLRPHKRIHERFLKVQDSYLKAVTKEKGIVELEDLEPVSDGLYLWQGDITTLRCDGIVNAANSGMTGCYVPNHSCIDNCIHFFSGIQLRMECGEMMERQGHEEETGNAKLTRAYNLPCRYILHTVGPIIKGAVTKRD